MPCNVQLFEAAAGTWHFCFCQQMFFVEFLNFLVGFHGFHNSKFLSCKNNCKHESRSICNRSCIHDTVNSKKEWEDHDQRQQEKYLSCKGHDDTKLCLADRGKKSGRHRLYPIGKSHQHKDAEIFFRKLKVQIVSVSEDAHDLMWEELEADKKYHSDNGAKCYGTAVSLTHTAVFFGSVIKTPDGLGTLGDSDADSHKYLVDF